VPVLLAECLALLEPAIRASQEPVVVDATLGLGGHAHAILERFPQVKLLGLDRDPAALALASQRLAGFGNRFQGVGTTYDHLPEALAATGHSGADAILFDLGVSSMQLDEPERGFSYARPAPLDMRMDPQSPLSAADVLNTYSEPALAALLWEYGDERHSRRIARAIVAARSRAPLERTDQLVELVRAAIPAAARRTGGNPAKRTFQALRIEVNDELAVLRRAIPAAIDSLRPGGRMVVLSYHSGEDRIVKAAIAAVTEVDLPPGLPVIPKHLVPRARVLTRGAAKASEDETQRNPRAASVRMRGVEKLS
jgi:16S rRNA (cytosine1402-N4)-methyltransferase